MRPGLTLLLFLFLLTAGTLYYLIQAGVDVPYLPQLLEKYGIQPEAIPKLPAWRLHGPQTTVPPQYQSGNSRFSQGQCDQDNDCVVTGCSNEVCARVQTPSSCELEYDFPQGYGYSCGCVNKVCGWK